MRKVLLVILLVILPVFLTYCKKNSTGGDTEIDYSTIGEIDYSEHVAPLLLEIAEVLEEDSRMPAGLSLDSWSNLIKGWERGEAVIPFDADNSLLYELLTKSEHTEALNKETHELAPEAIEFLARWINEGAKNDNGDVPYEDSDELLYVCSQNSDLVSVIDVTAKVVIRNIDLTLPENGALPPGAAPHHVAVSPDDGFWYVSTINPAVQTILKFNKANQLQGSIQTEIPALLAHHPTEDVLYASRFMNPGINTFDIFVLNTAAMTAINGGNIPVISAVPHGLAAGKDGNYIYVVSLSESNIMIIEHATKELVNTVNIGTGKQALQAAISPDNQSLYVSCIGTHQIFVLDISDPLNAAVTDSIDLAGYSGGAGLGPWHPVFSNDGSKLYIGNNGSNNAMVIDTQTNQVVKLITSEGLAQPHGSAISRDGRYVFISSRNVSGAYTPVYELHNTDETTNANIGTVVVIDTQTDEVVKIIEIENFGSGMFVAP